LEIADDIYENTQVLTQARELYEQVVMACPTHVRANYMTGVLYLKTENKMKAAPYLLEVEEQDSTYTYDLYYLIGQAFHFGMDFNKAIAYYSKYLNRVKLKPHYYGQDRVDPQLARRRIRECINGRLFIKKQASVTINNVGNMINSPWKDYAPVLTASEDMMVFTSRRQDGNLNENVAEDNFHFEDMFISHKTDGQWQQAVNINEPVGTAFHDSNLALSADGSRLYIYRDENNGDIYYSDRSGSEWSKPKPMNAGINSEEYQENSISISQNEEVLFFSSNRPGGYGGFDIYFCTKDKWGRWQEPQNIGPAINTVYNEEAPFIDWDGQTLYFSSDGHNTMGGFDIFRSHYDPASKTWGAAQNLGYPINTPDDELYFVTTDQGKKGYYSSIRDDSYGQHDIYQVVFE